MSQRTVEHGRLEEARAGEKKWRRWGTYLPERQWGTVREDYSADGDAWASFGFAQAAHRAYRWGDDGLLGFCDNRGLVCFCVALWNGADPLLKERLFGLTGPEGNHGEDVKELYWYLDATPTSSYARALYKYPQRAFPYEELRARARAAGRAAPETEVFDTGIFDDRRYFDVVVEYAKADANDWLARITITNRGPEAAAIVALPQLWFRNTWAWQAAAGPRPELFALDRERAIAGDGERAVAVVETWEPHLGRYFLYVDSPDDLLFTDNDTNSERLFGSPNRAAHVKDAFHEAIVGGRPEATNPARRGTKVGALFRCVLAPGESRVLRLRYADAGEAGPRAAALDDHDAVFAQRQVEADAFFAAIVPAKLDDEGKRVFRQAVGGLLWNRQYYSYEVDRWLRGDPGQPAPPRERWRGRNREWRHVYNSEVLSMPDKWEYPWYAAWDLAFHCIPMALVDPEFAKQQLTLLVREWYMHPSGQIPAYEWQFGDVNPPVHAWASFRVYQIERRLTGRADRNFLEAVFLKLMLNFTWWVNRKDASGRNVFEGGFLGLDNIGVFDRSRPLPELGTLEQADATSWMGMYCLNMLDVALELARFNPTYQDVANKFFEHFLLIAHAMNNIAGEQIALWDETDGFYYDVMQRPDGRTVPVRIRSMVGLIPLFAVTTLDPGTLERAGAFWRRAMWLLDNRTELAPYCPQLERPGRGSRRLLSLVSRERLPRILGRMLSEQEFLSPYGVRSLSRAHAANPYELCVDGQVHRVAYEPAESRSGLFGGNSNWRGPVWWPVNYLLIESLQRLHHYYGDAVRVDFPTGSGNALTLWEVATELARRLTALFRVDASGRRPSDGVFDPARLNDGSERYVTFYEYFDGDTGAGLGARTQTGWTALVAKLLEQTRLDR